LRLKAFASLLAALLLLAALAVPAFAEPDEFTTTGIEATADTRYLTEDEVNALVAAAVADLQPQTTIGIVPINDDIPLLAQEEDEGLLSQRNLTFVALGWGATALLLSIIALARTRKKTPRNATGNYQKYF